MEITEYLSECVKNNTPVAFVKYGDGEFNCMFHSRIHIRNCDGDSFTSNLSNGLIQSFKYFVENTDNSYIGLWHADLSNKPVLENVVNKDVKWANYHTIIFDTKNDDKKAILYKTIKGSKLKKIIICNKFLIKSKILLNIDDAVYVSLNNWFDNMFNDILEYLKNLIGVDGNHIVITCTGMGSKVLICELTKLFPKGIYLDFGSALDLICTKRDSRGNIYDYNYVTNLLKDCLPENWEDNKYNNLYIEASHKLGIHLPK